jgi:hypothetical protein
MASEAMCEVKGCARLLTPGKGGTSTLCGMHYQRKRRGALLAGPSRSGDLTGRLLGLAVTSEVEALVNKAAEVGERGVSDVVREALDLWAKHQAKKSK